MTDEQAPDFRFYTTARQVVVEDFAGFVDAVIEVTDALAAVTASLQKAVDHLKVEDN